jgi:predicted TIM-barrel fold metal-dependent hydrolase
MAYGYKRSTSLWGLRCYPKSKLFGEGFFFNRGKLQVTRFIHEEAVIDRTDPVRETRWLQEIADLPESEGFPHGIVAFADFSRPNIEAILEAHCAFANTREIRQFVHEAYIDPENPKPSLLEDYSWRDAVGLCQKYDLVFDLQIYWQQTDDALKLLAVHLVAIDIFQFIAAFSTNPFCEIGNIWGFYYFNRFVYLKHPLNRG